jgi:hypothetical protein
MTLSSFLSFLISLHPTLNLNLKFGDGPTTWFPNYHMSPSVL